MIQRLLRLSAAIGILAIFTGIASANTYYIDFNNGSDSNDGFSKNAPWKHHPFMVGATGNAAAHAHAAGDHYIFKGGVVWGKGCFDGPRGMNIRQGGSAGNPDYYGVDQTWFAGGSWTKPVFQGLPLGVIPGGVNTFTQAVSTLIIIEAGNFITFDSLEMRYIYFPIESQTPGSNMIYAAVPVHDVIFQNLDLHGWWSQQSSNSPATVDGAQGGIYINDSGHGANVDNNLLTYSKIHNDDGGLLNIDGSAIQVPSAMGNAWRGIQKITHNEFYGLSAGGFYGGEIYAYNYNHDFINLATATSGLTVANAGSQNTAGIWAWQGSSNVVTRPCYVHHNVIINSQANVGIYVGPANPAPGGVSCYIYDNVIYGSEFAFTVDASTMGPLSDSNWLDVYFFNNTVSINRMNCFYAVQRGNDGPIRKVMLRNNHCIVDGIPGTNFAGAASVSNVNYLEQNHATAANRGYTAANKYAPSAAGAPTVGSGLNLATSFSFLPDFDTDINKVVRLRTINWDIGAYQFNGSSRPKAPTNLTLVVQ